MFHESHDSTAYSTRVLHAGGDYADRRYSNSLLAFETGYQDGYRYFEVDLIRTADQKLVCGHSWFGRNAGYEWVRVPLKSDFEQVMSSLDFPACTLDQLMAWVAEKGDVWLITDVKQENVAALRSISEKYAHLVNRIIPQIYFSEDFHQVRQMGYGKIIWTLYRFKGAASDVIKAIEGFSAPFALAFDKTYLIYGLPHLLQKKFPHVNTYVHVINDPEEMCYLSSEFNIFEVYTDSLFLDVNCK
ncbi:glycerophosphodiester phosphodiesterase family protein [Cellvibrio polysaccharolyticus]|uniref:GP-PDE domain-containing protein n=1 Tax=Cellvibrio polysaccharolyticus TaxID=2082724 RepID=A0A928V423_9GAMM|nr:glycerophosphodiester phosphodiesterase family protein [Cellvibrio polysaccharolyticus]MBE8718388.1 hypothetical protein [Cellvibrio polysaccharolyticus]